MREIKFRAWDKDNKRMLSPDGLFSDMSDMHDEPSWFFTVKTPHPDDCELMQYTGLKDKNDKEIYEGDIVQVTPNYSANAYYIGDKEAVSLVGKVSITISKGVIVNFPSNRYTRVWSDEHSEGEAPISTTWSLRNSTKAWEVIGNIYQNPELLKENK